jgi:hypothetical protein
MKLFVEVSAGEVFDKLSILEIKLDKIRDESKLTNIRREYAALLQVVETEVAPSEDLLRLRCALKEVNAQLWRVEDDIRAQERAGSFGTDFARLARSVYRTNDQRSALKRQINELLGSDLVEEKAYSAY